MKKMKYFMLTAFISALASCGNSESKTQTADAVDKGKACIENIMARTSIRSYTDQTVSADTIDILLKAGMAAPTAVNKQPWHFVAVTDKEILNQLAKANPNAGMAAKAPLGIVVCGDMTKTMDGPFRAFWIQDCSAATENILLAAHALGLGAVWTGLYPNEEAALAVREVLKAPDHIVPLCTIVIGYPAEQTAPKDKWKPENVSYNHFGDKAE